MKIIRIIVLVFFPLVNIYSNGIEARIKCLEIFKSEDIRLVDGNFSDDFDSTFIVQTMIGSLIFKNYFVYEDAFGNIVTLEIEKSGGGELSERNILMLENEYFDVGRLVHNVKIYDFNSNGIEDILFFQTSGMGNYCQIFEFRDGEIINLLAFPPALSYAYPFHIINHNIFRVFPSARNAIHQDGSPTAINFIDYQWNIEDESFQIVNEGFVLSSWNQQERLFYPVDLEK